MTKRLSIIFTVLFILLSFADLSAVCSAAAPPTEKKFEIDYSDPGFKGTQADMNEAAFREYKRADDTLNQIYNDILLKYKNNKTFIAKFEDAQLAWLKFRDAHLDSLYPEPSMEKYGSIYPMAYCLEKTRLTWDRVKQLNEWLEIKEGTGGLGSRGQYN